MMDLQRVMLSDEVRQKRTVNSYSTYEICDGRKQITGCLLLEGEITEGYKETFAMINTLLSWLC